MKRIRVLALLACCAIRVWPQANQWPALYQMGIGPEAADSGKSSVQTKNQSVEGSLRSEDKLQLGRNDSSRYLDQRASLTYNYDPFRAAYDYALDLSGAFARKRPWPFLDYLGLEWMPYATFVRDPIPGRTRTQGKIEAGPMAGLTAWGVPVGIDAGAAATFWNDSVPGWFLSMPTSSIRRDVGFYGGLNIGRYAGTVAGIDLEAEGSLYGRSMPHARLLTETANLLARRLFGRNDTIYLFADDTLVDGNDAFISESGDRTLYINKPPVLRHVYRIAPAIRGAPRFHIVPAATFDFSSATESYPDNPQNLRNRRDQNLAGQILLNTDSTAWFSYSGGLRLARNTVDWLYDRSIGLLYDTSSAVELNRNLGDYEDFTAETRHTVSREFLHGFGISYTFDLRRESRTYPQFYIRMADAGIDTVRNNDDNDRISIRHVLELPLFSLQRWDLQVHGEYGLSTTSYVRSARSGNNRYDSTVLVGLSTRISPLDSLIVSDSSRAKVDMSRYRYPYLHTKPENRPPYSRSFSSRLHAHWGATPLLGFNLEWFENYKDDGKWYGHEYIDTTADSTWKRRAADYYAIEIIMWTHSVRAGIELRLPGLGSVETGAEYNDVYYREWNQLVGGYEVNPLGTDSLDYRIIPFVNGRLKIGERILVDARFRPVIEVTLDRPARFIVRYWDFSLAARMLF